MIVYDRLWETMKKQKVSTYTLREKYNVHTDTIRKLRHNLNMNTNTLSKLCEILDCRLEDIAEYKRDENETAE